MDFLNLTVEQIRNRVRKGELKAVDVAQESLKRIKANNPKLNAFITISEELAFEQARAVDEKVRAGRDPGILAGVPVAVKDMLCTKGVRTTAASKILNDFIPPYNATVVEKLVGAGAIVVGKANQDEFAMGSSNENSAFGNVKNPWDLTRVPGGSSGGSAAAVAARLAPAAIGTDTGGSIRQPASFCGITGIKPTYGRVSRYGVIAFASSLDQVGPMTQNVKDAAIMLEAICGKDPKDSTSASIAVPKWSEGLKSDMKGMTVGLPKEYFDEGIEPDVRKAVTRAIDTMKAQGAKVVDISLPLTPYAIGIYYLIATSEASSNLARYDGIRFGHRTKQAGDLDDLYKNSRGEGFGPEPKRRIMLGTYALSSGYYDAYYKKASQARRLLKEDFLKAFNQCDVIACPVTTGPAFRIGEKSSDPLALYLNDIFTLSLNLAGLPGMSVNCGFTESEAPQGPGLPIGLQLMSKHFEEDKILRAAYTVEQNLGLKARLPNGI